MTIDYKVIDMPATMSRDVKMNSKENPDIWVRDESWYKQTKEIYQGLLSFFEDNDLIMGEYCRDIDQAVILFSDLNNDGQNLAQSGAIDRWLASFDRPGRIKSPTDTNSLKRALDKIRAGAAR